MGIRGKVNPIICCIYKLTSPEGKVYIGQTVDFCKRMRGHRKANSIYKTKIQDSIIKHGLDAHNKEIVQMCKEEELDELEIYYGRLYRCQDEEFGLNIQDLGYYGKHAESTRKKIGDIHRGKTIADHHKLALSKAHKGKKLSTEHIAKIVATKTRPEYLVYLSEKTSGENNGMWGKKHSESTREKIGAKSKGRIPNEQARMKMSLAQKGKINSPEHRSKISESRKRIVLNLNTGIYYYGVIEAAASIGKKPSSLYSYLGSKRNNKTSFIYV